MVVHRRVSALARSATGTSRSRTASFFSVIVQVALWTIETVQKPLRSRRLHVHLSGCMPTETGDIGSHFVPSGSDKEAYRVWLGLCAQFGEIRPNAEVRIQIPISSGSGRGRRRASVSARCSTHLRHYVGRYHTTLTHAACSSCLEGGRGTFGQGCGSGRPSRESLLPSPSCVCYVSDSAERIEVRDRAAPSTAQEKEKRRTETSLLHRRWCLDLLCWQRIRLLPGPSVPRTIRRACSFGRVLHTVRRRS